MTASLNANLELGLCQARAARLTAALMAIVGGISDHGPRVIAAKALAVEDIDGGAQDAVLAPAATPLGHKRLYQGYRGESVHGAGRWDDLTPEQHATWVERGFTTRIVYVDDSTDCTAQAPGAAPTGDELRLDWCVRTLERVKSGGRAVLGDAYPEFLQVIDALRHVMEPEPDAGPVGVQPHARAAETATLLPVTRGGTLTERKANDIIARGYQKVGYVLQNGDGAYCICAQSAVRWIGKEQYQHLMHSQHVWPEAASPAGAAARTSFETWARANLARAGAFRWLGTFYGNPSDQKYWECWSAGKRYGDSTAALTPGAAS